MVTLSGLGFRYEKHKPLFEDLNLTLAPGNIYGLLGKNGAGKTTLLKIISGLIYPERGKALIGNRETKSRSPGIMEDLYFLPEVCSLPKLRVDEYMAIYSPFYPRFSVDQFYDYLKIFGIDDESHLSKLSHGEKKKIAIAFALAASTKLLLLDEPTNGLDIPGKSTFRKLIAASFAEDKIIVISTHQVRDMNGIIDPVVILDKGRVILNESLSRINSRVSVAMTAAEPGGEDILYYESTMGGYAVITKNDGNDDGEIDIELLFNSVVGENSKVNTAIGGEVRNVRE